MALARYSTPLMEKLGAEATGAEHRLHYDQIAVTRGLLRGDAGAELIWAARTAGGAAGFFHAAAVHCERNGRSDATRLFLAMQALERGDRKGCNRWAASTPYARLMDRDMQPADFAGATWLTQKPWTDLMHEALAAPGLNPAPGQNPADGQRGDSGPDTP